MTQKDLLEFAKAWEQYDYYKLSNLFTDTAEYRPSVSLNGREIFKGKDEIIEAIKLIQEFDNAVTSEVRNIMIHDNFGFWEWEYTDENGVKTLGCDVFLFEEKKIKLKNAYRKISS